MRIPPVAALLLAVLAAPAEAAPVFDITPDRPIAGARAALDARPSAPPPGLTVARAQYDLDGDGVFEVRRARPLMSVRLRRPGPRLVRMRVRYSDGSTETATQRVRVRRAPRTRMKGRARVRPGRKLKLRARPGALRYAWRIAHRGGRSPRLALATAQATTAPQLEQKLSGSGRYDATVVALEEDGDAPAAVREVAVGRPPSAHDLGLLVSDARPEPGQDLLLEASARGLGGLDVRFDFGDGGRTGYGAPTATHTYDEPGRYDVMVQARGGGERSTLRTQVIVGGAGPAQLSDCVTFGAASELCTSEAAYGRCMNDLRAGTADRCELEGAPLQTAVAHDGGQAIDGCAIDPALSSNPRCDTTGSYRTCRQRATGNIHEPGYKLRHCVRGDEPLTLEWEREAALRIGPGDALDVTEGRVRATFSTAPAPQPDGPCDPAVAAALGGSCEQECLLTYHSTEMKPDAPDLPVIENLPCGSPHETQTNIGLGNEVEVERAACADLTVGLAAGETVVYDTAVWIGWEIRDVWSTSTTPTATSYEATSEAVTAADVNLNVPMTVTCVA